MKLSQEEFEIVAKFLYTMKQVDPGVTQWNVTVGGDVVQKEDLSFNRFIYINGNMVELRGEDR